MMLKHIQFRLRTFLFLLFVLPASGCALLIQEQPVPEIKKNCAACHGGEPRKGRPLLAKPLSELCLDCHAGRKAPADHAVDVVPKAAVKKLPLSDGKMTCVTCHDPHRNKYGRMLRVRARDLCFECHRY